MDIPELEYLYRHQADDKVLDYRLDSTGFLFFLNEAQRKAARNGDLIFDKTSGFTKIPVVVGKSSYKINSLIYAITNITMTLSDSSIVKLNLIDRLELDRIDPLWRTKSEQPYYCIYDNGVIELSPIPIETATLNLEVQRYPVKLESSTDDIEIKEEHHEHLIDWVIYRAFKTKDADSEDIAKSDRAKQDFLNYFGQEPRSNDKRNQFTNTPLRSKAVI